MEAQEQAQDKRSYDNSPWINVYDWMVTERENGQTGEKFWDVKLPSETYIEVDGQKVDVGRYHFSTQVEPALTSGEAGSPKAVRGIHFPEGWDITLQRFENIASEGKQPEFVETERIEKVAPEQIAAGMDARMDAWRASHGKANHDKAKDNSLDDAGKGLGAGLDKETRRPASEPSL